MRRFDFIPYLIQVFVPQRRAHYFTKPAITLAVFLVFYILVEFLLHGELTDHGPQDLMVITAVQLPFLTLAFVLVIYLDKTQRKLADLAMTDMLTDLPNRRKFSDEAGDAIARNIDGFMLIIDADHFKRINDTYGHAVGDVCLKAISHRLGQICTQQDVRGRIGGEEFGAFLANRTERDIQDVGRKLTRQFRIEAEQLAEPLRFTLSVGAAEAKKDDDLTSLMRRADEALYDAKTKGRGRLIIWRKSIETARNASAV